MRGSGRGAAVVLAVGAMCAALVPTPGSASSAANQGGPTLVAPTASLPVVYRVNTSDPVVFITIDDGITRNRDALAWVKRKRLPVTSFLTTSVTEGHYRYFERMSRWGSLQNHTVSHPFLDTYSGSISGQICPVQNRLAQRTGVTPWLFRPPYGAGARLSRVHTAAASCGITHVVMWDAVVEKGRLTTWNGQRLSRGSIILLHYTPNLKKDLRVAYQAARAQGLEVAALEDYLTPPR